MSIITATYIGPFALIISVKYGTYTTILTFTHVSSYISIIANFVGPYISIVSPNYSCSYTNKRTHMCITCRANISLLTVTYRGPSISLTQ
jgi:hypothetical protein